MNAEERELMQGHINRGYELFVKRCADGRSMTSEQIKQIAEGRVWSGTRAIEIGLIDAIGNVEDAVKAAASLAQIDKYEVINADETEDDFLHTLMEIYGLDNNDQELIREYKTLRRLAEKPSLQARMPYSITVK